MSTIQQAGIAAASANPVRAAIAEASVRTDTDFDYLLAQARIESALDPQAKARTSSAAGLYQFIDQTWLQTLYKHGDEHGLGWASNAISMEGGRARITDPGLASAIMQLRHDPQTSALMAGELASDNAAFLEANFGRSPDHTELYLAHFLGAEGARKFIAAHEADPGRSAASLFPQAANANKSVFYDNGRPRSLGEVRELFAGKLERFGSDDLGLAAAGAAGSAPRLGAPVNPQFAAPAPAAPPAASQRPAMSDLLRSTFSTGSAGSSAPAHVANAYDRIARFGL